MLSVEEGRECISEVLLEIVCERHTQKSQAAAFGSGSLPAIAFKVNMKRNSKALGG